MKNRFKTITMQNQEKIIQAIAEYLEGKTIAVQRWDGETVHVSAGWPISTKEIAAEILAAIAPHLEAGAGWEDAPEWAEYTATFDGERYFFEDIFYPCRFVRSGRKTIWKGDFKTQVKNTSWDGVIERRPK